MNTHAVEPVMTRRDGDLGWLASTPAEYPLRFAVVGRDEAEAVERFQEAVARWEAIPEPIETPAPKREER